MRGLTVALLISVGKCRCFIVISYGMVALPQTAKFSFGTWLYFIVAITAARNNTFHSNLEVFQLIVPIIFSINSL